MHCLCIVDALSLHCLRIVYALSLHCLCIVYALSLHCVFIADALSTHCLRIVSALSHIILGILASHFVFDATHPHATSFKVHACYGDVSNSKEVDIRESLAHTFGATESINNFNAMYRMQVGVRKASGDR